VNADRGVIGNRRSIIEPVEHDEHDKYRGQKGERNLPGPCPRIDLRPFRYTLRHPRLALTVDLSARAPPGCFFLKAPSYWPDRVGGLIGCGEVLPEPVVLGDLMPPCGVIPVVAKELLLAVLVPWLMIPAITTNAISTTTAIPAIQPKGPPMLSPCGNPVFDRGSV